MLTIFAIVVMECMVLAALMAMDVRARKQALARPLVQAKLQHWQPRRPYRMLR